MCRALLALEVWNVQCIFGPGMQQSLEHIIQQVHNIAELDSLTELYYSASLVSRSLPVFQAAGIHFTMSTSHDDMNHAGKYSLW